MPDDYARETLSGFEVRKNVTVRCQNRELLDEMYSSYSADVSRERIRGKVHVVAQDTPETFYYSATRCRRRHTTTYLRASRRQPRLRDRGHHGRPLLIHHRGHCLRPPGAGAGQSIVGAVAAAPTIAWTGGGGVPAEGATPQAVTC